MKKIDYTTHALFPVPLCTFTYKRDEDLEKFLREQKTSVRFNTPEGYNDAKNFGLVSENIQILRTKKCQDLRDFILQGATHMAKNVLGFDIKEMVDVLSWVSIKRPNDAHTPHVHPNSIISGVYYFDSNVETTPIRFSDSKHVISGAYEMRIPKMQSSLYDDAKNMFSSEQITVTPSCGTILMFPSYLKHSVVENNSVENRYSLAFNLLPKFNLGTVNSLTFFNYKDAI
jgi:uncharacterized protein (TIGR02466 family)